MSDSTTKPQVALVGAHSDSFVQALQAADFNVEQCSSILDPATPSSIAVLALTGDDYTLSVSDVNEKLRAGTVLALFGPSRELLETIQEATDTPIDVPGLELADGLPLLVYMVNGVVHIATNNLPSEAQVLEVVQNAIAGDTEEAPAAETFSVLPVEVHPLEQTVMSISNAVSATRSVGSLVSDLVPPPGVIGFKRGTLDNTKFILIDWLAWRHDGKADVDDPTPSSIQKYDLQWYTDYYSYATGADCRGKTPSEFTKEGGIVYTLVIERGYLRRSSRGAPRYMGPTDGFCGYYFVDCNRTGNHSDSMVMQAHQPRGADSTDGATYRYSINFQQEMQMFNNNGNSQYPFKVHFSNSFSLDNFQLHGVPNRSEGVDFSVDYKGHYDHWADPNFKTSTWWNPGVYEKRGNREWVRHDLPDHDIPINGLTLFSSSVGKHSFISKYSTRFEAFKSNAWRTTDDTGAIRLRRRGITYNNRAGWRRTLDLNWPRPDYGSSEM